jgi:hypothetical protein
MTCSIVRKVIFFLFIFLLFAKTSLSGTIKGFPMPTAQDEKDTYTAWGWTWSPNAEPASVREPIPGYSIGNPDIHGNSEGDDLWTYLMMYLRTNNQVYLDRAKAWAQYFKAGYRTGSNGLKKDYGYDWCHVYGWGLIAWSEYMDDAEALAAAESIPAFAYSGQTVEAEMTRGTPGQERYGSSMRGAARHLLLAVRLAEATQKQRWIAWRDKLLDCWLQAPDWDPRGMYFNPAKTREALGSSAWDNGARCQSTFQIGVLTEAFAQAWRTTGRPEIKEKMIAMAKFVDQYGIDPVYQYTGSIFGIVDGKSYHNYFATGSPSFADPVYTGIYSPEISITMTGPNIFSTGAPRVFTEAFRSAQRRITWPITLWTRVSARRMIISIWPTTKVNCNTPICSLILLPAQLNCPDDRHQPHLSWQLPRILLSIESPLLYGVRKIPILKFLILQEN